MDIISYVNNIFLSKLTAVQILHPTRSKRKLCMNVRKCLLEVGIIIYTECVPHVMYI